jgi:hypothetical protein
MQKKNKIDTWESLLVVQIIYTYNKLRTFQYQFLIEGTSCIFGIEFRVSGSKYFTGYLHIKHSKTHIAGRKEARGIIHRPLQ